MSGTPPSHPHGTSSAAPPPGGADAAPPRRSFLKEAIAVIAGALTMLAPVGAGIATFLGPVLRRKATGGEAGGGAEGLYKVATLDTLTDVPQTFKIIADRVDGWNTFPNEAVGQVYMQKVAEGDVRCFNVTCPHAGCAVAYKPELKKYFCPCHNSSFELDGKRDPASPSPRDLDSLEVDQEKLKAGEIWIKFHDFKSGTKEKHPTS